MPASTFKGIQTLKKHEDDNAPKPASIGGRIRSARKALGMNQGGLAQALGVSQPTVANWEADAHNPRQHMLARLSEVLDVSLGWLAGGQSAERLAPDHPAASYLSRGVTHVPILPPEALNDRSSLMSQSALGAAIDYVPVSMENDTLVGVFLLPNSHTATFPGEHLFIFNYAQTMPVADSFCLIATASGPSLHRWSTALSAIPEGEVLGTLTAAIRFL